MAGRGRDNQRQKVYTWETGTFRNQQPLTLEECQALVNKAWKGYHTACGRGPLAPTVKDGRGRRRGCYESWTHSIKLPVFARKPYYVLHEVAHGLSRKGAVHGPEFFGVYLELLAHYLKAPKRELGQSARAAHIKVGPKPKKPARPALQAFTARSKLSA